MNPPRPTLFVIYLAGLAASSTAQTGTHSERTEKPAEESRLNVNTFREALKKRGLTELLELHLKDFPPSGTTETLLALREVKLADYHDPRRGVAERLAAAAEANRILEDLIRLNPDDIRRFEWRFLLASSLLYEEAEPYLTNLLYYGGGRADASKAQALTSRAVVVASTLVDQLVAELARVEQLPVSSYEPLERSGYIEELDRLPPKTEYLLMWALLYDSLARAEQDHVRAAQLHRVLEILRARPEFLTTPHASSRIQVQAMLLAGMTHRLLNDFPAAREQLDRALATAERVDAAEVERIRWAVNLAHLEKVRTERDDLRLEDALSALGRFRKYITSAESAAGGRPAGRRDTAADPFAWRVAAALLERSIWRTRAEAVEREGRPAEAERYRRDSWKPLATLVERHPDHRDEVFALLYGAAGRDADPQRLDPLQQCALLMGLVAEAARMLQPSGPAPRPVEAAESVEAGDSDVLPSAPGAPPRGAAYEMLDRAVAVGEQLLRVDEEGARDLMPDVVYSLAVAQYRRGRLAESARRFLQFATDYPLNQRATSAATYAADLAAALDADPAFQGHPEVQRLYLACLEHLLTNYPQSEAARGRKFSYARLLEEMARFEPAAAAYAQVEPGDEQHLNSLFFRLRALARTLDTAPTATTEERIAARKRTDGWLTEANELLKRLSDEVSTAPQSPRASMASGLVAQTRLLLAEVTLLPGVDRPAIALETLAGFEQTQDAALVSAGRVWRARLLAYQALGRLDEAAAAIPAFIAADPAGAGPTLQSLYLAIAAEVDRLRAEGDESAGQAKADVALLLAQQVNAWLQRGGDGGVGLDARAARLQVAEAELRAGHWENARVLFAALLTDDDARVLLGHCESLFRMKEWSKALPGFNRLAVGLPADDPARWKALLRDLQCRTALKQPPGDILKVIEQQRYLYPGLGGPELAAQFEKLQRENQRRSDGG
ncbi:MAG: hypothetical protein HY763_04820 [Planctomycetes bacterium]|nr:hypothetical protein [Planctomycetota bacterium]